MTKLERYEFNDGGGGDCLVVEYETGVEPPYVRFSIETDTGVRHERLFEDFDEDGDLAALADVLNKLLKRKS
jgi:hypothetical protein